MRKPTSKILVLLMALILMVSLLPATALAAETTPSVNWSLTLCDKISANFYVGLAEEDVANTVVEFSLDGQTLTVNATDAVKKDDSYVFTVGLAAAQMTDEFEMAVITNGSEVFSGKYSIRKYAEAILNGNYAQRDKDMVVAMLNYGSAAQAYFKHNVDAPAIAGYEAQVKTYTMPETVEGMGVTGQLNGIKLHGASLLFKSRTTIRFYFDVTGNVADYTFTDGNGKTYTPDKNGDYYSLDVTDINPQNLADIVTITVSDGNGSMSVKYSALQYMVKKQNSTTANLPELVQAMYDYYKGAMKYLFVDGGKVTASNSWAGQTTADNWGGVYFNLAANDAPYTAWGVRYKPTTTNAIQLIRDGVTYDVANTGWETITRANSDTEYYLEGWTLGDLKPFQANDIVRINGSFYDAANRVTLTIEDSYLLVLEGGQMYLCAGEPVFVDGGVMSAYSDTPGLQNNGFYFSMPENAAGVDNWGAAGTYYRPVTASAVKLIRNGEASNIGLVTQDMISKFNATSYFYKVEGWMLGDKYPLVDDDVVVLDGNFYATVGGTTYILNLGKTYAEVTDGAMLFYTVQGGTLQTHSEKSGDSSTIGAYGELAENALPYGGEGDWSVEYAPVSADVIKLVRNGETTSVGNTGAGTLVKFGATDYFLKYENWMNGSFPLQPFDYLIVDGVFQHNAKENQPSNGQSICINTTYVYYDGATVVLSAEAPNVPTSNLFKIGVLGSHAEGKTEGGFYATAAASDAPYEGWVRYKPLRADCVQFYDASEDKTTSVANTSGEMLVKYSETEYYFEGWTMSGTFATMAKGDYYIIEGEFYNAANDAYIVVDKTYVAFDGEKLAFSANGPVFIFDAGRLNNHPGGAGPDGVHALMAENAAPDGSQDGNDNDWDYEYTPVDAANYRVIRDGVEQNIGQPGRGTLVKFSSTGYYLKFSGWCVEPFTPETSDVFIIEGHWKSTTDDSVILNISKTYLYHDGTTWVFSEYEPMDVYELGVLGTNVNGLGAGHYGESLLYFSVALNDAPTGEYYPAKAENLKFVRGETVYNIGVANQGTLAMYDTGDHCLKLAGWTIADGLSSTLLPLNQETDYLIVEGLYIACTDDMGDSAIEIPRSYVYHDGYNWVWSDSEPIRGIATGPLLSTQGTGTEGVYVTMAANDAPVNVEYTPVEAENYQVIRKDGTVETIGQPGRGTLVKYNSNYFLKFLNKPWCIAEVEVTTEDIVVVSGLWQCNKEGYTDVYLNIAKSYVYFDGSAWVVSQTLPSIVNGGVMSAHDDGFEADGLGFFTLAANGLPVDDSGDVVYTANAGVIKLSRAGKTYDMSGYVMKLDEGYYYMELSGSALPMQEKDYLIVEGNFVNEDNGYTLNIAKSYIFMDGEDFIFTTTEPEIGFMVTNLNLSGNPEPQDNGGVQFYVSHDAHGATVNSDWNAEYTPISADAIKLVRNGETFSVGVPGQGTLVALNPTSSYIKFVPWTFAGDKLPLQEGDTVILDGLFQHNASGDILNIEHTEIVVGADGALTFPNTEIVYNIGTLGSHGAGKGDTGFYATATASDAPYDEWKIRYKPVSADCVKFYDASEKTTTSVANTGGEMLVKFSKTEYYFESWTLGGTFEKLAVDDYYIIEGRFYNEANNCYIQIEKTYASFDGETFVFSTTEPVIPYHVVDITKNPDSGWDGSGNIYFLAAQNEAPFDTGWGLRYKPVSAEVIKLLNSDGTTSNIANTGAETIVKYSETNYFVEGWTIGGATNVAAGNTIIIEGKFHNAANNAYIDVEKTYITFNADGTIFVISENDKNIDAGHMGENDHSDGNSFVNWHGSGIYFTLAANNAPSNTDWSIEYMPVSANTIKLIRGGNTYDVANTGGGTIKKLTDTLYYLKVESWLYNGYEIQDGDVLVFEGGFTNASNGYTINIAKTYVTFKSKTNDQVIFSKDYETDDGGAIELPVIPAAMTYGVWNGSHHTFNDDVMQELVNAGITRIIGVRPQYAGDVNALLDRAQAHGISVILDIRNYTTPISLKTGYSSTASKDSEYWDGSSDIDGFDLSTLDLHHPALEGLSVFDEPWVYEKDVAWIKAARTAFDALDKKEDLLFFVNLLPECSGDEKFWGTEWSWTHMSTSKDYLDNYVNPLLTAGSINEYVSWDDYSLIRDSSKGDNVVGIRSDYFHGFEDMVKTGKPTWYTMLSAGHTFEGKTYYYKTPSQDELRWQMAVAMAFGVQNINHYTFTSHDAAYAGGCMYDYDTNTFTDLFQDIKTVDNEFLTWDEIFMAYDYVGTNTYGVSGMTALENGVSLSTHGISSITSSNGGVLVGVFENNGDKAYMITNAGSVGSTAVYDGYQLTMGETNVTLTFTGCSQVAVIDRGEISVLNVTNNTVQIPVGAYEGVFVIPVA